MSDASTFFNVYRAPNGKFYLTRESELVRMQSGGIVLFDTQQDVVEFLAEMGNVAASLGRGGSNEILTIFTNNLKGVLQWVPLRRDRKIHVFNRRSIARHLGGHEPNRKGTRMF